MDKQTSQSGPQTNPNAVDHLITAFVEITSATTDEALFFLESHNFDLDAAVSTFLESTSPDDVAVAPFSTAAVSGDPISASPSPVQSSPSASLSPSRSRSPSPASRSHYNLRGRKQQPASGSGSASAAGKRVGGIRTFADLNRNDGEGSDSDSDQPQEYYTGGQKSGMLVQDPRRDNNVDNIFDQARQFATDGPQPSSSSMRFTGRGRLLSGETVSAPLDQQPQTIVHTVTFWQNGFTVNDGPLRGLDDPENASFLESIRKSECPRELDPPTRSIEVRVNLVRKEQNCPEPKKPKQFFQGAGRTLGSSSGLIPSSSPAPKPTPTPFGSASLITAPTPSLGLVVDSNLPTTSIQLRLADGTRMVSRFNLNHTVGDIRAFIDASRRGTAGTYHLQTMGFPPKQLTDLDQTIEQAGLASSVIIQRL